MTNLLTKEEIERAKITQRRVIAECDTSLADIKLNIEFLQEVAIQKRATRKTAFNTLTDLEDDFPMLNSVTTGPGASDGTSARDAGLIGSTLVFAGKMLRIWPDNPDKVDTARIVQFDSSIGELKVGRPLKGGQVLVGVPIKVLDLGG